MSATDMKLEVQVIPVSASTDPSSTTNSWVGGSTRTSPRWTAFASSVHPSGSGTSVDFGEGPPPPRWRRESTLSSPTSKRAWRARRPWRRGE